MTRLAKLIAVPLALATVAPAGAHPSPVTGYRHLDTSTVALNILPPGQGGHLNSAELPLQAGAGIQPDHYDDQLAMYENLVGRAPSLTRADLDVLFKDASFGVAPGDVGRIYSPRHGLTVIRDLSHNVPHVYGSSRSDTMFGAGYVSGEDRLFMMDLLRNIARGRMSEFLGGSPSNIAADAAQRLVADYTEEELQAMVDRVAGLDPVLGPRARNDLLAFTDGVNAFINAAIKNPALLPAEYPALQLVPQPWKATDSAALATLIGGVFSVGGGGQLANSALLSQLESSMGASARAVFDDFRNTNDPEAPVSTHDPYPFNTPLAAVDPDAVARPDNPSSLSAASMRPGLPPVIDGPFGPIRLKTGPASNALLVSASHSASGRPLAVFGPQVGYYSPEILMEIDMHGPGVHARGAAFPGISLYALLGRGAGYGWSATTAIADHVDIRAVELCEPFGGTVTASSTHYLRDGVCRPMYRRTDNWVAKPGAAGTPAGPDPGSVLIEMTTERVQLGDPDGRQAGLGNLPIGPDWAIVVGRGTVGGKHVAFARQRSSYGIELDQTLAFTEAHDPSRISSVADLQQAFGRWFNFSFNWHFVDGDDVGFYTTGRYPVLAPGVDPDMPSWGDSRWDWTGFLSYAQHPQALSPSQGYITNWNNKQAPGFRAPDDWYSYGSVGRMQLLESGVKAQLLADGDLSITELTQVMGIAATQDLRGVTAIAHALEVIGTPSNAALQPAVDALNAWVASGAHRRDLTGDRSYEQAEAVAIADGMWEPLLRAIFEPVIGASAFDAVPTAYDDAAGPGGSAYLEGWYGHADKDLRQVLGEAVGAPTSRTYCGNGSLSACKAALEAALAEGVDEAVASLGSDRSAWGAALWERDGIEFTAAGVPGQREMHWQNRPTFQQVLEFQPN